MIHQYKSNGYNIVLDVCSGSVHAVDEITYDAIALYETRDRAEVISLLGERYPETNQAELEEILDELDELKDQGLLYAEDVYKDYVIDVKNRTTIVKALCLHVAHDCNLACRYCFAGEGEYHGERSLMSYEVGRKALDFLLQNSGSRKHLEVDFFGGEPLMNWNVVKQLVAYGRSQEEKYNKKFRFTLTTNGVLLNDEICDFCNKEMSNVVLSLDGRPEVNNRMRPFPKGKGSYDVIVPKFQNFVKKRGDKDYFVRGTFTRHNLDFSKDLLHYADLGFEKMSIEPVVAPPEAEYSIREEDLPRILEEYDILAKEFINRRKAGKGFTFFHFMIDLKQGPCVAKRLSGCGAGTEYLAVTPEGDLYPCHQFVGLPEFLLGNVDTGVVNTAVQQEFKQCNVYAKEKCSSCFARFYCSGGCAANSYNFHGSILDAYDIGCEMQKKRVECAIMIQAALADDGRMFSKEELDNYNRTDDDDCQVCPSDLC